MPRRDEPVWKVVATTSSPLEAGMIAERLKNAGIPASIQRESIANAFAFTVGALAEAKILVPETFYQQALDELGIDDPGIEEDDE
jgi:hypothetical protein